MDLNLPSSSIDGLVAFLQIDLNVTGHYNRTTKQHHWSASLSNCETLNRGILSNAVGFGSTPEEAINELCVAVSNKTLVLFAMLPSRLEVQTSEVTP